MLSEVEIMFLVAVLLWSLLLLYIYLFLFRQPINIRLVSNYDRYYKLGRSYWLPDLGKGFINWLFNGYYKLRKMPVPKPADLPLRRDHNKNLAYYNKKYAEVIKKHPALFGKGYRVMYIKVNWWDLWPKRYYYLSPMFFRRNEYYIYGYPPIKVNKLNPRLDHWVIEPDLKLINDKAKLDEIVETLTNNTAHNRSEIGEQVEISMMGDPVMTKDIHAKSTLLNNYANEQSQVRELLDEIEGQDFTPDEIREMFREHFGLEE